MTTLIEKEKAPEGSVAPLPIKLEGLFKLDVDHDGYVVLEHVLGLVREEGLGKCCFS